MYAAAPGDPPDGSKHVKALEWLRRVNKDETVDPLTVLGKLIEGYMETPLHEWDDGGDREKIRKVLAQCKLQYVDGGRVTGAVMPLSAPSSTLEMMLAAFDYAAVDEEFNRVASEREPAVRQCAARKFDAFQPDYTPAVKARFRCPGAG